MYDTILDALRRNAPADALLAARELLAEQPENPQAHRLLASALRVNGDHEAALASIDHAIALAPEQASLHLERAGLLMGGRRLDEAQQALAQASGLDPNQFEAHVLQAQLALGRGDLGAAEQHNRLAARIAPDHAEVAAVDGMLALRRGDPAKALSILSQAAEADPENLQVRYALGFAYLEQGHLAFAEQAFRGVLEKTPDAAGLRGLVSSLVGKQGNPGQAAAELVPLLDNPASDTLALRMIAGGLEMQANRPEQALVHFKKVLAKRPDDRRVLASLTDAWRQLDARDDARATLEAALFHKPMVIAYAMPRLSYHLMWRKRQLPWVGLPNILCAPREWLQRPADIPARSWADRPGAPFVVPELVQHAATPQALAASVLDWLAAPEKMATTAARFAQLHAELRRPTAQLATDAIETLLAR